MRYFRMSLVALSVATALCSTVPAQAAVLVLDGGWQTFTFGAPGSSWSDSFTFTITESALLKVTDAFQAGDQFEVTIDDGTTLVLPTSVPTGLGEQIFDDYDTAFASPLWSSLGLELSAGTYTITGTTLLSPFGSGGAAIELESLAAIPEPATWALLIGGVGATGGAPRGRRRTTVRYA